MLEITEELRAQLAELYLLAHHLLRDMQELGRQREEVLGRIQELLEGAGFNPDEVVPVFDGYRLRGLERRSKDGQDGS